MLPYWIVFAIAATGALTERARTQVAGGHPQSLKLKPKGLNASWWLIASGLTLFIGLRHEVGGDWFAYLENFRKIDFGSQERLDHGFPEILSVREPGYRLFEWIGHQTGGGMYIVNLLCATIFAYGLARFCRSLARPWLGLSAAVPYLIIVVAMGYTRQAVAVSCAMAGFCWLSQSDRLRYVFWIIAGSLFHQSVWLLLPLALLTKPQRWFVQMGGMLLVGIVGAVFAFSDTIATLSRGYLDQGYGSEGALIRLSLNALPAILFLANRSKFGFSDAAQRLWTWMALGAVVLLMAYFVSPSSTAVDRIGLYLIPLQLAVFAHFPGSLGDTVQRIYVLFCLAFFLLVMFVWLTFANHASNWIPYQSAIFAGP